MMSIGQDTPNAAADKLAAGLYVAASNLRACARLFNVAGAVEAAKDADRLVAEYRQQPAALPLNTRVEKIGGSSWRGRIVGTYSTDLTPEGYCVESENEPGSVQIYPVKALRRMEEE